MAIHYCTGALPAPEKSVSREKTSEKRQRILAAALKVFARRGFYNANVSEVAREASVADGTIYLYFKNKDDLLIQLFEDRMDYLIRRLKEGLEKAGGTVPNRIYAMIKAHLQISKESPALAEFITLELRQSSKFVKEYQNEKFSEYLTVVSDLIAEGQDDGSLRSSLDPRIVARSLFGALDETLLTITLAGRNTPDDIEKAAQQLNDLLCGGLTPRD